MYMKRNIDKNEILNSTDLVELERKWSKMIIGKFDCRENPDELFEFYSNDVLFKDFQVLWWNFWSAIFKNCIFKNCLFEWCKFNISDFEKCDLLNCNFLNCKTNNLNLKKCNSDNIKFSEYEESEFYPWEQLKYQI